MDHKATASDRPIDPFAKDPEPEGSTALSFKEKLKTLHFGMVPGGYRDTSSTTMIDHESLLADGIPTREETEDRASTARRKIREAQ